MKAMVLHNWGETLKQEDIEIPKIGPNYVLVRVRACAPDAFDLTVKKGFYGGSVPLILGHEISGEVVEVGQGVSSLNVGDRVTNSFFITCGHCSACRSGRENLCSKMVGMVGVTHNGGYAEYVALPAANFCKVPDNIPFEEAAILGNAISTPLHALRARARVKPLDTVLITGAGGGVGLHAIQIAKLYGAKVIAAARSEDKLAKARGMGADATINIAKQSLAEEAKRLTDGKGVDVVIELVCSQETIDGCVANLATGGRMVILTSKPGARLNMDPGSTIDKEITITGSMGFTSAELLDVIELVKQGRIKPIVTQKFPLAEAEKAHQLLAGGKIVGRSVLVV